MRFAICDDNREHIDILKAYFDAKPALAIETEPYENGEDLVRDYTENHQRYDALFIDMEMGGMNGIETANAIRAVDEDVIIVFVTSHTHYAPQCFECDAARYLVKPLQEEKVYEALSYIEKKLSHEHTILSFYYNKEYIRLSCHTIFYCESEHNGSVIYTQQGVFRTRMTISELEEKLEKGMFCRVHRSYLVNLRFVKTVNRSEITLQDGTTLIPIGKAYRADFDKAMIDFEEREYFG